MEITLTTTDEGDDDAGVEVRHGEEADLPTPPEQDEPVATESLEPPTDNIVSPPAGFQPEDHSEKQATTSFAVRSPRRFRDRELNG